WRRSASRGPGPRPRVAQLTLDLGAYPLDLVGIGVAVGCIGAAHTAVVAEQCATLVAAESLVVVVEDAGAVAQVRIDVVQIGPAPAPLAGPERHDLHQAACADGARRAGAAAALDQHDGNAGLDGQPLRRRMLDERPRDPTGPLLLNAAGPQPPLDRLDVLAVDSDVILGYGTGGAHATHTLAQRTQLDARALVERQRAGLRHVQLAAREVAGTQSGEQQHGRHERQRTHAPPQTLQVFD